MDGSVNLPDMGDLPAPGRPATYDDLLALPDNVVGEIVGGELHVSPRPAPRHAVASSALGGHLGPPFHRGHGGPGGWWILDEPELHLRADVVVPDLAGWRRNRMPVIPDTAYFETAPDWICEVVSPGTARLDRHGKLDVYARAGVAHAWLVDPLARTLEVLQLEHGRWVILAVLAGDDDACVPPFTDITIPLASLWAD